MADDSCGSGAKHGTCQPPPACAPPFYEACGCDGSIYASECDAYWAGVDVSRLACGNLSGHNICGPYYCDAAAERCRRIDDLSGGTPDKYGCIAPPACVDPCDPSCPVDVVCGPCPLGKTCGKSCVNEGSGLVYVCTQL